MSKYKSLSELRRALTAEDPDRRANAYGDVMAVEYTAADGTDAEVAPSEVLADEPDETVIEALRAADVLPEQAQSGMPTPEYRNQVVDLLKQIAANTGGA